MTLPSLYHTYFLAFINVSVKQLVLKFVLTASIKNDLIKYIIHIFVWALHKSGDWTPFLEI